MRGLAGIPLAPTPPDRLLDEAGRPYFLWDTDTTVDRFRALLAAPDPAVRAYWLGKLMRQAKPDDVFTFVEAQTIAAHWDAILPYLGETRAFWAWLFDQLEATGHVRR